jgi:cell division protein FtsI (penicillin-binding protein 3)
VPAVFAIVVVFVVRLVDIQLVQAEELNAESYSKRAQELVTYGVRGSIVDTNGVVLAGSVDRYDIVTSPRVVLKSTDVAATQKALTDVATLTGQDPAALMAVITADPESDFAYLATGVPLEVYRAVRELDIPWLYYDLRPGRTYPNGAVAGNLVGFVGTDGPLAGEEFTGTRASRRPTARPPTRRARTGCASPGASSPRPRRRTAARSASRSTATCSGSCSSASDRPSRSSAPRG